LLIGAGLVHTVECGGIVVGEFGAGVRFRTAVREGRLKLKDSTCPVIHAGLQAGAKGVPFASLRGIIGSDLLQVRPEWRVIDNPFTEDNDPVLLVPALTPDCFIFHARWGDRFGNVWTGGRRDLAYTAHASRNTLVTVEHVWDGNLLADPIMAAGTLSEVYVTSLAHVPGGSWPLTLQHEHDEDTSHVENYMRTARTDEGFQDYLNQFVLDGSLRQEAHS
jgi:glutaconate CoA-transferase subunit A